MSLVNTKSVLAKLLAAEDINVQHGNVPTAYFDLKSRTLMCPTWVDMDGDLYDLVMGHEVGHALETPAEGWHNAVVANKKFKTYLNVIEDARIEKKIKRRYPGLSKSFNNAYKSLAERDFFGIRNLPSTDQLSLIDRINLRCKLGAHCIVQFNDVERELLRQTEAAETWEEVVDIAKRVFDYTKENEQDKISNTNDLQEAIKDAVKEITDSDDDQEGEEGEEGEDEDFDSSDDDYEDADSSESSSDPEEDESEDSEESDGSSSADGDGENEEEVDESDDDDPESVTDKVFRDRESELVNASGVVHMMELPEPDFKKIMKTNDLTVSTFETVFRTELESKHNIYGRNNVTYEQLANNCVAKFNKNNRKYITHILKEFEMRKKASEYARTQTARTGELEMGVLHKYKFSNDLFKKISVIPKGKNHGMILFLDMSGSMYSLFRNTVEQLLVLTSFCKLANIPFEVYGFSNRTSESVVAAGLNASNHDKFPPQTDNDLRMGGYNFHLLHLLGSGLSKNAYTRSFNMLAIIASEYNAYHGSGYYSSANFDPGAWTKAGFGMDSTPTLETLLASRKIITDFRAATRADIVNVVYLTDGVGDNDWYASKNSGHYNHKSVYYIVDKKTKKKIRLNGRARMQETLTALVRDVTGCKHIGFYLTPRTRLTRELKYSNLPFDQLKKLKDSARTNNFFATPNLGYDNYFYVGIDTGNISDGDLAVDSNMTKAKIASEFKKHQRGKSSNRVLVSRFSEEIAA